MHQAQKPKTDRKTSAVKDGFSHHLDKLTTMFGRILTLMVGSILPGRDADGTQDVEDLLTNVDLGKVTDKVGGSTTGEDVVLQSVEKRMTGLHAPAIRDKGGQSNDHFGQCGTTIDD